MGAQVTIIGVERCHNMLVVLPMNTLKEVDGAEDKFMGFVQKSARLRAPRFSGALSASIKKNKISFGKWELTVDSPYGWFQEFGWQPVGLSAWTPSRSGYLVGDWIAAHIDSSFGGYLPMGVTPRGIAQPFITPAFESGIEHLPQIMQDAVLKAAKESI